MKRVLIDTNILLRLLLNDIPSQKKITEELLQKARNEEISILVPEIIIFEIEFSLSKYYCVPKHKVIEKLQTILAMNFIDIERRQIFTNALELYSVKTVSLVDCFVHTISNIEKYELFTFDKKILRASL